MHRTPVIVTAQGALPEFIVDGVNGYLLDLPVTEQGEWVLLGHPDRGSAAFARAHREAVDALAEQTLDRLVRTLDAPASYPAMQAAAYESACRHFDSEIADRFWDALYARVAAWPLETDLGDAGFASRPS